MTTDDSPAAGPFLWRMPSGIWVLGFVSLLLGNDP